MREAAFTMEQWAAKLGFQGLDRPTQRGLRDVAALGGAR